SGHRGGEIGAVIVIEVAGADVAQEVGDAAVGDGGTEAVRVRDDPVRHKAAVAAARDAEPRRVGAAGRDGIVYEGQEVREIRFAPASFQVGGPRLTVPLAPAGIGVK